MPHFCHDAHASHHHHAFTLTPATITSPLHPSVLPKRQKVCRLLLAYELPSRLCCKALFCAEALCCSDAKMMQRAVAEVAFPPSPLPPGVFPRHAAHLTVHISSPTTRHNAH
jgi:hypothetical protein